MVLILYGLYAVGGEYLSCLEVSAILYVIVLSN